MKSGLMYRPKLNINSPGLSYTILIVIDASSVLGCDSLFSTDEIGWWIVLCFDGK